MVNVNAHLHTPWSFSAFGSIPGALDMAVAEDVRVVGINDFYTTGGYGEWSEGCRARRLYPLFGIEMIALDGEAQRDGLRINDPANPGRMYMSGKGLAFQAAIPEPFRLRLEAVRRKSGEQVVAMADKLNAVLEAAGAGFTLDGRAVEKELTMGNLRERHLAKALRIEVYRRVPDDAGRRDLLGRIFGGRALKSGLSDLAGVENEIRAGLLKAGGAAFVAESPDAFLPSGEVTGIIRAAGGIPTYPFLGDDAAGNFTDFERDLPEAVAALTAKGIHSAEFITQRNSTAMLEKYAGYLWSHGFVVTMGSEHNTPAMEPLLLHTLDGAPLSDKLKEINYMGACVVAAHQDAYRRDGLAYDPARRDGYVALGDKLIREAVR